MYNERVLFATTWDSKLAVMETSNLVRIYVRKEGNGVRSLSLKKKPQRSGSIICMA